MDSYQRYITHDILKCISFGGYKNNKGNLSLISLPIQDLPPLIVPLYFIKLITTQ